MEIGALLVLLGLILAIVDVFVDTSGRAGRATLLHAAVILVAIGVLIGVGDFLGNAG